MQCFTVKLKQVLTNGSRYKYLSVWPMMYWEGHKAPITHTLQIKLNYVKLHRCHICGINKKFSDTSKIRQKAVKFLQSHSTPVICNKKTAMWQATTNGMTRIFNKQETNMNDPLSFLYVTETINRVVTVTFFRLTNHNATITVQTAGELSTSWRFKHTITGIYSSGEQYISLKDKINNTEVLLGLNKIC